MTLLECETCGQTYNPQYMQFCARCGEPLPDEKGKLPRPSAIDGMGGRGGVNVEKLKGSAAPSSEGVPEEPSAPRPTQPSQAVEDMVLEYRNRLNQAPEDNDTRYSLALAYLYAGRWERAEEELQVVVEALPDFADAHARLAVCRARAGKPGAALEAARAALKLTPGSARYQGLVERLERAVGDE